MKTGIIYKAESPSGKVYIGLTTCDLKKRKKEHLFDAFNENNKSYKSAFPRAIRKYGESKIAWNILHEDIPCEDLPALEIKTIADYDSFRNGYNSTEGGEGILGHKHTRESKAKISNSKIGKPLSQEHKNSISETHKGKKLSQEHKAKIGKASKGRKHTKESKNKISKANIGTKNSSAKLSWNEVALIRKSYKQNSNYSAIGRTYGVSYETIARIIKNRTWKI